MFRKGSASPAPHVFKSLAQNSLSMVFLAISDQYETFNFNFYKMAAGAHFGCPKFTFDRISGHFRSIRNFGGGGIFDLMAASAILDVRNSLSIAFLAILD